METPHNGNNVTWRELNLALSPLQKGLDGLDGKVDEILIHLAEQKGSENTRSSFLESTRFWITTSVVMFSGTIGAVATIIWLKAGTG